MISFYESYAAIKILNSVISAAFFFVISQVTEKINNVLGMNSAVPVIKHSLVHFFVRMKRSFAINSPDLGMIKMRVPYKIYVSAHEKKEIKN